MLLLHRYIVQHGRIIFGTFKNPWIINPNSIKFYTSTQIEYFQIKYSNAIHFKCILILCQLKNGGRKFHFT